MNKQELICYFRDHRADDWGYCDRCEKDYNYWHDTLPAKWRGVVWRMEHFIHKWIFGKCFICGKTDRLLGFDVGKHDDCYPF